MGQIHPWWDSNDISHLYRSFLNEVNWVLRGPSSATCIFNCSESCSSEGSFPCLRKNHFWVWETQAKPLTCFTQSSLPYLNSRSNWSVLSIQKNLKKHHHHSCLKMFIAFDETLYLSTPLGAALCHGYPADMFTQGGTLQEYWHEAC